MALKRQFSMSGYHGASKRLKPDLKTNPYLCERQWETVQDINDDGSSWFKFTVASYNVLAQNLLETNRHLYRKCLMKHLSWQYRKSVIRDELALYRPDILCLQEVQCQEFSRFFLPELQKLGYFGLYKKRTSEKEDGCATFFKHEKFVCVSSRAMEYKYKGVEVLNRDNVGLLLLLKPVVQMNKTTGKNATNWSRQSYNVDETPSSSAKKRMDEFRLCVANTHLLFNPKRGDVKLAQLMTLMAGIDEITGGKEQAVVMCGDFNSQPHSGLYNFLISGRVDCKDISVKHFSGQLEAGKSGSVDDARGAGSPYGKSLPPNFLDKAPYITDQCQFVNILQKRSEESNKRSSPKLGNFVHSKNKKEKNSWLVRRRLGEEEREDEEDESSSLTDYLSWSESPISYTKGSGLISHNLRLKSAYDHDSYSGESPQTKQISTFIDVNCSNVDYILYSQSENKKSSPDKPEGGSMTEAESSLNNLFLLRRLKLFTESEIKSHYSCMPNADLGSDHTILMSEFGVRL